MKNIIGETYNQLTVIEDLGIKKANSSSLRMIKCNCTCGNVTTTNYKDIKSGHTKSCGCLHKPFNRSDEDSEFRYYLKMIKGRNKSYNVSIDDLRKQWAIQHGKCVYTNIPLILATHTEYNHPKFMQASIDRIDSKKGYEVGNIQFVSAACNFAKNSMSHDEMKAFIDIIKFGYENLI